MNPTLDLAPALPLPAAATEAEICIGFGYLVAPALRWHALGERAANFVNLNLSWILFLSFELRN